MQVTNIHEARPIFSKLVERAAGEEIIIGKAGKPVARLVQYKETAKLVPSAGQHEGSDQDPAWFRRSGQGD